MSTVLMDTVVTAATAGVLAALLVVAERYLANYGPCSIDINQGSRTLEVQGGKPLLAKKPLIPPRPDKFSSFFKNREKNLERL